MENIKDVVKYIEEDNSTEEPADSLNQLPWCKCGACREMPTEKERKCCDRKTCVTSYKLFSKIFLDRDVLLIAIKSRNDFRSEEIVFTTNSYRHAAYRQYIMWKYGKLGKHYRRVIPSCVVWRIRLMFPSVDGTYTGYKEH